MEFFHIHFGTFIVDFAHLILGSYASEIGFHNSVFLLIFVFYNSLCLLQILIIIFKQVVHKSYKSEKFL